MKQNKSIQYPKPLKNLRIKNVLKSDFDLLKPHFIFNLNVNLFDDPCKVMYLHSTS